MVTLNDFKKVEMRVGTIVAAEKFPKVNIPAYKLKIDFGGFGIKNSSAEIADNYTIDYLKNKQIIAIVNVPPKNIAGFESEVLVLGTQYKNSGIILLELDTPTKNGTKIS